MSFPASALCQVITYWNVASRDKFGDPSFEDPVELYARWEDITQLFIDTKGEEAHSHAIVYCLTELPAGGFVFLGSSSSTDPQAVEGADMIRRADACPDVKNRKTLYKAYL